MSIRFCAFPVCFSPEVRHVGCPATRLFYVNSPQVGPVWCCPVCKRAIPADSNELDLARNA